MKKLLFLLIPLIVACNPCKRLQKLCPPQINDSISYVERIKIDTLIIKAPGDTTIIEIPIDLTDYKLTEENKNQKLQIEILKGKLKLISICKEDSLRVIINNLEKEHSKIKIITTEIEKPVIVHKVPKFHKFCTWGFIVLVISAGIYIFIRIKQKWFKSLLNQLK